MANVAKKNLVATVGLIVVAVALLILQVVTVIILSKLNGCDAQTTERQNKCDPAITKEKKTVSVTKEAFGSLSNGAGVDRYTIKNSNGAVVKIITYGAIVTDIAVPDRNGHSADVTLGYDDIRNFELNNTPYFGAIVGRVANRIGRGRFTLDNITYQLNINNGVNHLHGGPKGWSKRLWQASAIEDGVLLTLFSEDGDEKYPGEVTANVTYRLADDNELVIQFQATTKKKPTPINLTSHPYFNLAGGGVSNNIDDHYITIYSDYYLKSGEDLIPTGEILHVRDTLLDLRRQTRLGDVLPLFNGSGYDHTFSVRGPTGRRLAARAYHPPSGRQLEVYTDQPGIQFYTSNFLSVKDIGKRGHSYQKHSGFCLETHNYPDAVNHANFPDSILREGSTYEHWAWYKFSVLP